MNNDFTTSNSGKEEIKDEEVKYEKEAKTKNNYSKFFMDWIMPIILALIIAGLINKFLLFKVYIPSESMVPTLKVGDQLFVTKIYDTDKIKREEILVFFSEELNDLLIKRVIGLPGDTVEIKENGDVYVNGNLLNEPYVKNPSDKSGSFKVPKDKFLFLGDNRAISKDSRWWNDPFIDKKEIKGKAWIRIYPFDRIGTVK